MNTKSKAKAMAYLGIVAVILIWGVSPLVKKALIGDVFSASVYTVLTSLSAATVLLLLSLRSLKQLNRSYFKVAIPMGLCVGVASLSQALAYKFNTSPVNQAFLENLSCIVVPLILFLLIRKRPRPLTVVACALCLVSSMVLTGVLENGMSFHTADLLNMLAGVFYGINIALTGIYAKQFVAKLYVMIQLFTQSVFYVFMTVAFHFIHIDGAPVDAIRVTDSIPLILGVMGVGILTSAVCWTVRTAAMKHVSPTVVAIIMPFSAVITGILAVVIGQDQLSLSLVIGAVLGVIACIASGFGDMEKKE